MASFLSPLLADRGRAYQLVNSRTRGLVVANLLTAFDSSSRRIGLLRHDSLRADEGMVIAPTSAIHTFFMRFPIAVLFVNRDGVVLKRYANVRPWRIAFAFRAFAVVELPVSVAARTATAVGDRLLVEPR